MEKYNKFEMYTSIMRQLISDGYTEAARVVSASSLVPLPEREGAKLEHLFQTDLPAELLEGELLLITLDHARSASRARVVTRDFRVFELSRHAGAAIGALACGYA
jgi:hypothetical protein